MIKKFFSPLTTVTFTLLFLLLAGCSQEKIFISLPEELKDQIGSSDLLVHEVDKELGTAIENSNLGARTHIRGDGGLLASLVLSLVDIGVESHRKGAAKDAIKVVQAAFENMDMQAKVNTLLSKALKKQKWIKLRNTTTLEPMDVAALDQKLVLSDSDVTVVAKLILGFNSTIDSLTARMEVTFYATNGTVKDIVKPETAIDKPILRFQTFASETLEHSFSNVEDNGKQWSKDNAKKFKTGVNNIIKSLAERLDQFLSHPCSIGGE